jgi:hypothetical protein
MKRTTRVKELKPGEKGKQLKPGEIGLIFAVNGKGRLGRPPFPRSGT